MDVICVGMNLKLIITAVSYSAHSMQGRNFSLSQEGESEKCDIDQKILLVS